MRNSFCSGDNGQYAVVCDIVFHPYLYMRANPRYVTMYLLIPFGMIAVPVLSVSLFVLKTKSVCNILTWEKNVTLR